MALFRACVRAGSLAQRGAALPLTHATLSQFLLGWLATLFRVFSKEDVVRDAPQITAQDTGLGIPSSACDEGGGPAHSRVRARSTELPPRRPLSWTEADNRRQAAIAFDTWLMRHLQIGIGNLPSMPSLAGPLLAAYGRDVFKRRKSLAEFTATVLAVQDVFRFLKPGVGDAGVG